MVFCTYCGQSFTRDEHLERHILTHTNVKPFKCFTCHMSFARRDLLQRHYTVHGRDQNQDPIPAANGMIPKSAGRTPIACSNCAKTKTKCDKKFPCSRCAGRNLKCTLRPTRRSTKNTQRVAVTSETAAEAPPNGVSPVFDNNDAPSSGQAKTPRLQTTGAKPVTPECSLFDDTVGKESQERRSSTEQQQQQQFQHQQRQQQHSPPVSTTSSDRMMIQPDKPNGESRTSPSAPLMSPPMALSMNSLMQTTPLSGFDQSNGPMEDTGASPSPRFLLDWSQLQVPLGYDNIMQPGLMIDQDLPYDPSNLPLGPGGEILLPMLPDLNPSLITPMETPRLDRSFSTDLELDSSIATFDSQKSSTAMSASNKTGCAPLPLAAHDAWSVFCCGPKMPSATCPKTARTNLELLEHTLRDFDGWNTWSPQWVEGDLAGGDYLTVMQLHESTRDKLLAITQSFLLKALETHKEGQSQSGIGHGFEAVSRSRGGFNFVLLPPTRVVEYFLRAYTNSFERNYPLTPRGVVDANELIHCYNERAASLLLLMMMAQGAMTAPSREARMLTTGFIEVVRVSLLDLVERDIVSFADPVFSQAALLFVVQAAWSGDKWQMDSAVGQHGLYMTMLRQTGILDAHKEASVPNQETHVNKDQLWNSWIVNERRSRLVYSWVMADQELSLLHDSAPLFSATELELPLPDADRLWQAKSAADWSTIFERVHEFSGGYSSVGSGARPMSLLQLFRHLLNDEMIPLGIETTPLQLRLLLHPIQSLVHQHMQTLQSFAEPSINHPKSGRGPTAATTRARLSEVQSLLRRWFDLAERYLKANPLCALMQSNLIIFHLTSLNAVTNFREIERLARGEDFDGSYAQTIWKHKRCIHDVEEAIYHCGQALRVVRSMPRNTRPPWWAGAVYRVALVLWTDSLTQKDSAAPSAHNGMFSVPGPSFAIDTLSPDHPLIVRYLTKREGVPCVTKRDGSQTSIDNACDVLMHCCDVLNEGPASNFSDGIRAKLERLSKIY